jgi:hypothetical protein
VVESRLTWLTGIDRQLLDITHTSVHGFDFLSNAIWVEVRLHVKST